MILETSPILQYSNKSNYKKSDNRKSAKDVISSDKKPVDERHYKKLQATCVTMTREMIKG